MRYKVIFLSLISCATMGAPPPTHVNDILSRAQRAQHEFREGNPAVAKPLVKMLEDATARTPDNARLWEAMGHAYMSLQGSMYEGPPDVPALISIGKRARDAYARSLELDDTSALARASHGMSHMIVSQLEGDGPGVAAGVEEMNAAVRQSPRALAVRLTRAFSIVHLPPAMRDTDAVTEDLKFIIETAPGGRPEDVLHVLLGDVYAEVGDLDAARAEYERVTGASAFAAGQVDARRADLQKGTISAESIRLVRMGTATCAMCHAPGTDK